MLALDQWLEKVRRAEYLAEDELKALCDYVSPWWRWVVTVVAVALGGGVWWWWRCWWWWRWSQL